MTPHTVSMCRFPEDLQVADLPHRDMVTGGAPQGRPSYSADEHGVAVLVGTDYSFEAREVRGPNPDVESRPSGGVPVSSGGGPSTQYGHCTCLP